MWRTLTFVFTLLALVFGFSQKDLIDLPTTVFGFLPHKVWVHHKEYPVVYPMIVAEHDALQTKNGPLDGIAYQRPFRRIEVRGNLSLPDQESTLIHEMLHSISIQYKFKEQLTEQQVEDLETGLYETFQENRWHIIVLHP